MAAADALLDALRVPRQVVVDDGVAELQVQPLRPRLRRDQDRGALPELVDEREAHGHRRARRPGSLAVGLAPRVEGRPGPRRVVVAAEQRDVLVAQFRLFEQERAQVVLGRQGLGEDHDLAPVRRPVHDHAHGLDEARRLAVPRQGAGAADEVLDAGEFASDRLGLLGKRWRRGRSRPSPAIADVVLFLEVAHELRRVRLTGIALPEHAAQPGSDPVQALGERRDRRRHAAVKAEQEQLAGVAPEGLQGRRQEVVRDVVVEGALVRAHAVFEELRPPPDEGPVQELLRLPAQRALHHGGEPPPQFLRLVRGDATAIVGAEDVLEHGLVPEQRAGRVDVLDEAPEFAQGVLDRCRREEQDWGCADHLADPVGHLRLRAFLVVDAGSVVAAVDSGEDFVGFVDQAEVPGCGRQALCACLATGVLAAGEEDAIAFGVDRWICGFVRLDIEEVDQFGLPLAEEGTRHDDEDARCALGEELSDDEAGLDGFAESDFVREDAAAFRDAAQGEHHGVDLVGVRVHAAAALGGDLAAAFVGATLADEVFGVVAAVDGVEGHGWAEV